jgi:hypothetical protein
MTRVAAMTAAGTTMSVWLQRAAQARRIAETLTARDRELLSDYARECEFRARCLDRSGRDLARAA